MEYKEGVIRGTEVVADLRREGFKGVVLIRSANDDEASGHKYRGPTLSRRSLFVHFYNSRRWGKWVSIETDQRETAGGGNREGVPACVEDGAVKNQRTMASAS